MGSPVPPLCTSVYLCGSGFWFSTPVDGFPCVPLCPLWFRLLVLDPRGHKGSKGKALPAEVHRNARSRRDARTGQRRLFAGHAAADSVQVEPCLLRGFNRNAKVLADK